MAAYYAVFVKLITQGFCRKKFIMTKIIIQTGKYRGLYQIILLKCKSFFILKWWEAVSITEHVEEESINKLGELMKKYNVKQCDIYDWSGDKYYEEALKKAV
ncbi:hypothetical protein [Mucilaginibacter sp.]|uniref:hypothetical protein n=1 Tax=Mucilaginibacter sp. TaxID=1882438 RepID=UPI003B00E02C